MTVPHGLPSSYQASETRRLLVEEAAATLDGLRYLAILRAIDDWYAFDLFAELLSTRLAVTRAVLPHRQAKQLALARERQRRRAAPPA